MGQEWRDSKLTRQSRDGIEMLFLARDAYVTNHIKINSEYEEQLFTVQL